MVGNARLARTGLRSRFRSEQKRQYPGEHRPGRFADLRRMELQRDLKQGGRLGREPFGSLHETPVGTSIPESLPFSSIILDHHNPYFLSLYMSSYVISIDERIVWCLS